MKVKKVLCSEALTGFYMDDKEAIKSGAKSDLRFQPKIKRTGKQKKGIALLPDKQDRKMRKKFLYLQKY